MKSFCELVHLSIPLRREGIFELFNHTVVIDVLQKYIFSLTFARQVDLAL